jgi:hypothetical protein
VAKVWVCTGKAMHWGERALSEMGRALAAVAPPSTSRPVTRFDVEVVKRLLRGPRQEFNGRHPHRPPMSRDRNAFSG